MSQRQQLLIYGAGGFGREAAWVGSVSTMPPYEVVGFIDDNPQRVDTILNDLPVLSLAQAAERHHTALVLAAVGNPNLRRKLVSQASDYGFRFANVIHPNVVMSNRIQMGEGVSILPGCTLTTNITIGNHVQLNPGCSIAHDVVMGDYASIAPGVHVSGCVRLGKRVYIGTGAVIINGTEQKPLIIEDDAIIGAGACVTKSVAAGLTVVGVPAKPLQKG